MRTTYSPPPPAEKALELDCVESAHFWGSGNPFLWAGVVGVVIGQELNVRQVSRRRWYASDDYGRKHYGRTVVAAIKRAVEANKASLPPAEYVVERGEEPNLNLCAPCTIAAEKAGAVARPERVEGDGSTPCDGEH